LREIGSLKNGSSKTTSSVVKPVAEAPATKATNWFAATLGLSTPPVSAEPKKTFAEPAKKELESDRLFTEYEESARELVVASRKDQCSSVLPPMKSILLACKGITEECEILQESPGITDDDFDSIRDAKDILSESLTNLMTVTKEHASSNNLQNSEVIQERLKKLSYSVSDMVELIRLVVSSKQVSPKSDTPKLATKSKEVLNKRQSLIDNEDPPPMDMTDLRYYLEDNTDDIAHAIQDLLQSMRNTSASPEDLKKLLLNVQTIVDNIIFETRLTLSEFTVKKTVKDDCEEVLRLLESDYEKLGIMAKDVNDRGVKQQIANSSYEVAKVIF
jgi:hypothetical protein